MIRTGDHIEDYVQRSRTMISPPMLEDQLCPARTSDLVANAQSKLERKNLDLIVANDVSQPGVGFAHDTNAVTFLRPSQALESVSLTDKRAVARALLDIVVQIRANQ